MKTTQDIGIHHHMYVWTRHSILAVGEQVRNSTTLQNLQNMDISIGVYMMQRFHIRTRHCHAGKPEVIGENDYYVTGCDKYTKWLANSFQQYGTFQGRNISLDCYFASVTLAEWCLEKNITIVGTLKSDWKGIPKGMKGVADRKEKSTQFCHSENENKKIQQNKTKQWYYQISTKRRKEKRTF